jgi:Domain of unknown function (DUF1707)
VTPLLLSLTSEPSAPQEETPPRLRASDAEREAVVRTLLDAIARGLLTLQEGDERVAAAYAARYRDELGRLTADLPPAPAAGPVAPGWRALALLAWLQVRTAAADLARATRGAVRGRPRLVLGMLAALVLLALMAASVGGGYEGSGHGHHHSYSWDDDRRDHDHHDDD